VNIYRVADGARLQSLKIDLSTVDYANLDFSPDGQTLATYVYEQHCCSGYVEMTILWRVKDGTLITKLQPYQVIFSPDSQTLFSGGKILKTSDGTLIADLIGRSINNISNLGFTADGQQIIASSNPYFYIYQVTDPPSMLAEFDNKEKYKSILEAASPHNFYDVPSNVSQETTSPDGKFVASNLNGIVTMKNVTSTQEPFAIPTTQVTRVAFSPDGQTLALGLQNGTVELWDLKNKQLGYTIPSPNDDPKNYVGGLAFSPNGKLLAVGMKNGTLYLFRIKLPESP
jgi:WD40 repeat protein